jgi:hypothetical protein
MSDTKKLSGFRPSRMRGGAPNSGGVNEYPIANARSGSIYYGDIVKVTAGTIAPVAAAADFAVGIFMGCRYVDPVTRQPVFSKYFPSATSSDDGNIYALVNDDPNTTYIVQADASVTQGDMNSLNFEVTLGAGSDDTGLSGHGLDASTRTSIGNALRPIRFYAAVDNETAAQRAFPEVEVRINQHIDNRQLVSLA